MGMTDGAIWTDTKCPQQRNGFDCGPFTLLFTERVLEKINTGEAMAPIHVKPDDLKRCRSNLQKLIEDEIKSTNEGHKDHHGTRDPKDKNDDKSKDKNSKSGQASGQAPTKAPAAVAAVAAGGVSVPGCGAGVVAASGSVPVPGRVAAAAAAPGVAGTPPGTQRASAVPLGSSSGAGEGGKYSKVCRYHRYRKCMRRAECKYSHPNVCKNIEEFGLCEGKCELIHQTVCKSLWFCTRHDCGFVHPKKVGQRAHTGNGYGNAENRGQNQNGRDYQQYQGRTSYGNRTNRTNRNNRHDYQQYQGHTSYWNRNNNNGGSYQNYQDYPSQETHNINTNFLPQQPRTGIEQRMEELLFLF